MSTTDGQSLSGILHSYTKLLFVCTNDQSSVALRAPLLIAAQFSSVSFVQFQHSNAINHSPIECVKRWWRVGAEAAAVMPKMQF